MKPRILTLLSLALLLVVVTVFDYLAAVTLQWKFMTGTVLLLLVITILNWQVSGKKAANLFLVPLSLLTLVAIRATEMSPVKPFKAFHRTLKPGLDKSEVPILLQTYFPSGGAYKRPFLEYIDENSVVIVLDPSDAGYDAEVINISLKDGRINSTAYYPD